MPRGLPILVWREMLGEFDGVPSEAQQGQGSIVQNLYRSPSGLVRRGGFSPLATALSPSQSHDGLNWYRIGSTEYLIAAHDGKLVDWLHATPGTTVTNSTGKLTSGTDANAALIDARAYWGDGVAQNIVHDGTDAQQVLPAAPLTAPSVAVGAAVGLTGTYRYVVTFQSDIGDVHSELSPVSADITVANQKINVSSIPLAPAGQGVSQRSLWRNANGATKYYRVAQFNDNTTTTFTDDEENPVPMQDAPGLRGRLEEYSHTMLIESRISRLAADPAQQEGRRLSVFFLTLATVLFINYFVV